MEERKVIQFCSGAGGAHVGISRALAGSMQA